MKEKISYILIVVITLGLAVLCGYFFCTQTVIEGVNLTALIITYIVSIVLSVIFGDVIHEGGHLLAGLITRMGAKTSKFSLFGSSSVSVNPKGDGHIKGRMIVVSAAGLFFNLLCVIVGIISLASPQVPVTLCVLLPWSFYLFAVNVLPFEYSSGKTDGLVICDMVSNSPSGQVMLSILQIQGQVNGGKPLSEVDESLLLDLPQLPEDDINFIILTQLRYEYYLAKGNDSEAYKYFTRYKDLIKYLP